jgi:hypothetical protein
MRLSFAHVVVIGGGYVGQLIQLAMPSARLLDWRKTPPANHMDTRMGPQYLWEPIPLVESFSFPVTTLVDNQPPTPDSILTYKKKIGKEDDGGDWGLQFQHHSTGWHSKLPVPKVEYGRLVKGVDLSAHQLLLADDVFIDYDVLINTIPLDFFLKLCLIPPLVHHPWKNNPIFMVREKQSAGVDGMVLNYLSNPDQPFYRETKSDDQVFYETLDVDCVVGVSHTKILPGKIHPHPESEDVLRALKLFDVHCFGRFATWRPDELAHETWKHITGWRGSL